MSRLVFPQDDALYTKIEGPRFTLQREKFIGGLVRKQNQAFFADAEGTTPQPYAEYCITGKVARFEPSRKADRELQEQIERRNVADRLASKKDGFWMRLGDDPSAEDVYLLNLNKQCFSIGTLSEVKKKFEFRRRIDRASYDEAYTRIITIRPKEKRDHHRNATTFKQLVSDPNQDPDVIYYTGPLLSEVQHPNSTIKWTPSILDELGALHSSIAGLPPPPADAPVLQYTGEKARIEGIPPIYPMRGRRGTHGGGGLLPGQLACVYRRQHVTAERTSGYDTAIGDVFLHCTATFASPWLYITLTRSRFFSNLERKIWQTPDGLAVAVIVASKAIKNGDILRLFSEDEVVQIQPPPESTTVCTSNGKLGWRPSFRIKDVAIQKKKKVALKRGTVNMRISFPDAALVSQTAIDNLWSQDFMREWHESVESETSKLSKQEAVVYIRTRRAEIVKKMEDCCNP